MQLVNYIIIPEKITAFQSFNWLSIQESAPRYNVMEVRLIPGAGGAPVQVKSMAEVLSSISRYREQPFLTSCRIYNAEHVRFFCRIILR